MNINTSFFRIFILSSLFVFVFTSCASYSRYDGSTNFQKITKDLVEISYKRIKKNISRSELVLVSDFVNLSSLENASKLGFLLSDSLKDTLSAKDIIIRQVEFGKDFTIGKHGFNMLSRDKNRIKKSFVKEATHALIGTYTVTSKKLIVFIKLIDIQTGYILSSSQAETVLTKEILELEKVPKRNYIYQPLVL